MEFLSVIAVIISLFLLMCGFFMITSGTDKGVIFLGYIILIGLPIILIYIDKSLIIH